MGFLHCGFEDELAGIAGHGEALSRSLGVPDDPARRSPFTAERVDVTAWRVAWN